jgi:hypothetical protein
MPRHWTVWFAMIDGHQTGPMSRAEFAQRLAADAVDEETYVWKEGMLEWLPASRVHDLAVMFERREQARRHGVRPPPPPAAAMEKAKPRPSAAESEKEIELEIDLGALKSAMPYPTSSAKGSLAAVSASSATPAMQPPQTIKLLPYSLATVKLRPGPKLRHTEAAPGAQIAPPLKSQDDGDFSLRTCVEMLPLGERVHLDEVEQSLFDPSDLPRPGKTGKFAIDSLEWAYSRTKKETKSDATKAAALLKAMQSAGSASRPVEPVQREPVHPAQPAKALKPAAAAVVRRPLATQSQGRNVAILALIVACGLLVGAAVFFLLRLLLHL